MPCPRLSTDWSSSPSFQWVEDTSEIGVLLCALAVGSHLGTGTEAFHYAGLALLACGGDLLLCASAGSRVLSAGDDVSTTTPDDRISTTDAETTTPETETTVHPEEPPAT